MTLPGIEENPFTLVWDALWDLAESNTRLMQWISANNRRKYDSWIGLKEVISTADLPELALLTDGGESNYYNTSSTSMIICYYTWAITTGDFRVNAIYNQIRWELFRAMAGWCSVLSSLTWETESFVKRANMTTLKEGTFLTDLNRNIKGWASLWSTEVEMHFSTAAIRV